MTNIFQNLEKFITSGNISLRKDIVVLYLNNKGNKEKTIRHLIEWRDNQEDEYLYNEIQIAIDLLAQ